MKPNPEQEAERALDKVLNRWVVQPPLPPRFQEQVWQRLARAEAQPQPTFGARLAGWLEAVLPRPKAALAYLAALSILGMAAGTVAAQIKSTRIAADLSARYVQSVTPFHTPVLKP